MARLSAVHELVRDHLARVCLSVDPVPYREVGNLGLPGRIEWVMDESCWLIGPVPRHPMPVMQLSTSLIRCCFWKMRVDWGLRVYVWMQPSIYMHSPSVSITTQ